MSIQRSIFAAPKEASVAETKEEKITGAVYCDFDNTITMENTSNMIFEAILNGWYAMLDDSRYNPEASVMILTAVKERRLIFDMAGFPTIRDNGFWRNVNSPAELETFFTEAEKNEIWEIAKLTPIRGNGKAWREQFEMVDKNKQHLAIITRGYFPFIIRRYLTDPVANGDQIGLSKELLDKIYICCTPLTREQADKSGKNELIKECDKHFNRNARDFNLIMVEDYLPYLVSAAGLLFDSDFNSVAVKKARASEKQEKGLTAGGIYADFDADKTGEFIGRIGKVSSQMKETMLKLWAIHRDVVPAVSEAKPARPC